MESGELVDSWRMRITASWRRIWIFLSIFTILLIFSPPMLYPKARSVIMRYVEHPFELILYIIFCTAILIPISYVTYIALKSEKYALKTLGSLLPLSVFLLELLPYTLLSDPRTWSPLAPAILILFIMLSAFAIFIVTKGTAEEAVRRRIGFWAPKSWEYMWATLFFLTNVMLFFYLFCIPYRHREAILNEVIPMLVRSPLVLISYVAFCAVVLIPISRALQHMIDKTRFFPELLTSSIIFISFVPPASFLLALTHKEEFLVWLIFGLVIVSVEALICLLYRKMRGRRGDFK